VSLQGFDPTGRASGTGIITSSTPDPRGARVPLAGGIAKQSQFTVSSQKQLVEQYRKMSPAMRRALSQKLKDAGYQTPVTDQYNASVRQAFLDASSDLSAEINYSYTGRGATADEIAKWSEKINARLAKPSSFAETTYTPQGETTFQEVTPAFSPKEYLFQQIAKTDEAKANKVFGFYNAFKRALGVS